MKVRYVLEDVDGEWIDWANVQRNREIPVTVSSILVTEEDGERVLVVNLRSSRAKPTNVFEWSEREL